MHRGILCPVGVPGWQFHDDIRHWSRLRCMQAEPADFELPDTCSECSGFADAETKGVAGLARQRPSTSRLSGKLTDAASVLMTRLLTAIVGGVIVVKGCPTAKIFGDCHFLLSRDGVPPWSILPEILSTATDLVFPGLRCQPWFGGHRAVGTTHSIRVTTHVHRHPIDPNCCFTTLWSKTR